MTKWVFDFLERGIPGEWREHPSFPGVRLAGVTHEEDDTWRTVLVKVDPGKSLLPHAHEGETEFHLVVSGSATARRGNERLLYGPGEMHKIKCGLEHEVTAGDGEGGQ